MEKIFENEKFLVINKPYNLLSIPARGTLLESPNVYSLMKKEYGEIYIVHRLDRETSGLMLLARDKNTHSDLCKMFENRQIVKKYIAFVFGNVEKNHGIIDKRIKEFSSGRSAVDFNGKDSITLYKVLERFEKYTLLELELKTGRRHQIRVHLYSIGHPIVGDSLYGNISEQKKYPRLMLHSYFLSFNYEGKPYNFISKPDEEFYEIIKTLT